MHIKCLLVINFVVLGSGASIVKFLSHKNLYVYGDLIGMALMHFLPALSRKLETLSLRRQQRQVHLLVGKQSLPVVVTQLNADHQGILTLYTL